MSLKEWKNNEIGDLLTDKWGFKMDLGKLNEAEVKPDFADLDKDGDKEEPMKDAAEDAKEEDSEEDEESDDKEKSDDEKKGKGKLNPGLQAYLDNKGKK